ncbi:MAG: fasciclin domain-containing protein [Gemmatimonadota bacterium]|nr:fasciclin domain-containing protein [Gemmatimonadota bacterium]MDH3367118.1 fasciclin domain-containing protein [Gemmatimonadota bacterium]MDH3476710.1 fasciclin domain-containing protein [Gemmatimonadota bacterium]MDH3570205.1 fasciclin domain-containing protein [Gemmatimonadota bacterium]MDH5549640.1 fasciclin domain-containing protein [Gemmatimonadota bacterium]
MLTKFARKSAVAGLAVVTLGVAGCDETAEPQLDNIVTTAVNAGSFTTLVTAVQAASLDPTLANDGPFTVFAPTDDAFAALPAGTIDALLMDIPALTDVLLYHVVAGQVLAADVVSLSSATTLQGATVAIDASSGVKVNDANVIQTDVLATNGVIHVIDKVLLPPQ